jgi:DNA-binding transcriptional ArsR family regulator
MNIIPSLMEASSEVAEGALRTLANRHRLMILCQLIERERSVGELATLLKLRDSTVSQHLALLRKDRFVAARRDGQTIWYTLASEPARRIIEMLYEIYCVPARPARSARKGQILRAANGRGRHAC